MLRGVDPGELGSARDNVFTQLKLRERLGRAYTLEMAVVAMGAVFNKPLSELDSFFASWRKSLLEIVTGVTFGPSKMREREQTERKAVLDDKSMSERVREMMGLDERGKDRWDRGEG